MYYPYLRGRQFELLALRELVNENLLSEKIIPIIEPIKLTSTFFKTIKAFIEKKHEFAIILNPKEDVFVGIDDDKDTLDKANEFFTSNLCKKVIIARDGYESIGNLKIDINSADIMVMITEVDNLLIYNKLVEEYNPYIAIIKSEGKICRTVKIDKILLEDNFNKQKRNVDYKNNVDEFFSETHLYYKEDGYKGFADFSIIGDDEQKGGFAPMAVAIHIIYFDEEKNLRVHHFVSDSNEDIKDTPNKYYEALKKLFDWQKERAEIETLGLKKLIDSFIHQGYPGLGSVKKYTIMHHLELMSRYFNGEIK